MKKIIMDYSEYKDELRAAESKGFNSLYSVVLRALVMRSDQREAFLNAQLDDDAEKLLKAMHKLERGIK
jgi:hypothetical protein